MKTQFTIVLATVLLTMMRSGLAQSPPDLPADESRGSETTPESLDCAALARAHAALLNGCFSARRSFSATLNGKLALRELALIEYRDGELSIVVLEKEHPNQNIQIGGQGDMVVDSIFACERMSRNTAGRYELQSVEDPERIVFDYDAKDRVLLPLRWEFEQKARFLFRKFHIQAQADYSSVEYELCEPAAPVTRTKWIFF